MILAVAAAASNTDAGSVPLKVYWLTAGGVALLGLLGTISSAWIASRVAMKTNENHAEQIEKQLQRDRERSAEEVVDAHNRWTRDRRVDAYQTFMTNLTSLVEETHSAVYGKRKVDMSHIEALSKNGEDLLFWSTDRVTTATNAFVAAVRELLGKAIDAQASDDVALKAAFDEVLLQCEVERLALRKAMQQDLQIDLGTSPEETG